MTPFSWEVPQSYDWMFGRLWCEVIKWVDVLAVLFYSSSFDKAGNPVSAMRYGTLPAVGVVKELIVCHYPATRRPELLRVNPNPWISGLRNWTWCGLPPIVSLPGVVKGAFRLPGLEWTWWSWVLLKPLDLPGGSSRVVLSSALVPKPFWAVEGFSGMSRC